MHMDGIPLDMRIINNVQHRNRQHIKNVTITLASTGAQFAFRPWLPRPGNRTKATEATGHGRTPRQWCLLSMPKKYRYSMYIRLNGIF